MGRAPCCDKANVKKGPWSPEEDDKLRDYIHKHGTAGNWIALPQKLGLRRCGKSCRLRWLNYLRPNIKHGEFSDDEDRIICSLFASIGSRWSIMAAQLPGRTDNDIKNYWNTKLKKKLMPVNNYNIAPAQYLPSPHRLTVRPAPPDTSSPVFTGTNFTALLSPGPVGPGPAHDDNLLVFGGDQPDLGYFDGQRFSFGGDRGFSSSSSTAGIDGCGLGDDPLEYSIEEIKRLISTDDTCGNLGFFVKTEGE